MTDERRTSGVPGIDRDLELLFAEVEALRSLASDPEKADDSDRIYDFSIRWGTLLSGRLIRLEHYQGEGQLRPAEQARYAELKSELREALPLVDRLGLGRPTVPLEP